MVHIDNGYSYNEHTLTCDTTNPIYAVWLQIGQKSVSPR